MSTQKPWFWIAFFTILNMVTAFATELYNDEAYYWAYSRFLDWGYFDHPPIIALLIKVGYALIPNELGVRILSLLLVSASLWLIFDMAGTHDVKLFALLVFSVFPLFLFGITALPDSPMLFSVALFFWVYQQFLQNQSWKWTLILAGVMAFMLYTKYMGVLVILFTLASNLKLLRSKWFWMASVLGAVMFLPHLYWQYVHEFPSVKYHLVDRSAKAYSAAFTLEYIVAQLLFYGPFVGVFLYWAAFKRQAVDPLERALKFVIGGTLAFFLISSFKGRVEVNWTLGMLVPLLILALRYYQPITQGRIWLIRLAWLSMLVILLVRVHVTFPLADFKGDRAKDFHGHKKNAETLLHEANGLPLVAHRYQTASSLWFYTGKPVPVLNLNTRFSQYDLWNYDTALVNKPAYYVNRLALGNKVTESLWGVRLDSFPVFKFIEPKIILSRVGFSLQLDLIKPSTFYAFTQTNPLQFEINFYSESGLLLKQVTVLANVSDRRMHIPIQVNQQLLKSAKSAQIILKTDDLGVVRKFPRQAF